MDLWRDIVIPVQTGILMQISLGNGMKIIFDEHFVVPNQVGNDVSPNMDGSL